MTSSFSSRGASGRLIGVVALSGWWACQTRPATAPVVVAPASASSAATPDPQPQAPAKVTEPKSAVRPKPACAPDGVRWKGRREGCIYEVAGCCYGTPEAACTAAACGTERCQLIETSPAQIACRGAEVITKAPERASD